MGHSLHDSNIPLSALHDENTVKQWKESLRSDPYRSYLYAYPHKTAYRNFEKPIPLSQLWSDEPAETYFLYMHIPFCGARCGFCNLFTLPDKNTDMHEKYVEAIERQARQWSPFVSNKPFARFAMGGGTPTLLQPAHLERLFGVAVNVMGLHLESASISIEVSPETVTREKLQMLKDHRVDRVSMGVQSFVGAEAAAVFRPQQPMQVVHALELLRGYDFPILNLDLIYGLPGQTLDSWLYSLEQALSYQPEELFLYPLYTRDHTLVKTEDVRGGDDSRMMLYLAARDRLRAEGYKQTSMRRFSKADSTSASGKLLLPYSCQEEGMVGLGCGARSYTRSVHYSSRYAVSRKATAAIIDDFVAAQQYDQADYGIVLSEAEQRRRYVLKAILHSDGLSLNDYSARYGGSALEDHAELVLLLQSGWADLDAGDLRLTDEGLAYSDAIGDRLISAEIRARMEEYVIT
ncbi:STM4012 family radical SAM protein [Paenibacillus hamazuiensis]|uniref:STM4012 family radical SAM protein n=1 Tax=Paenibacillus hamazuiensis TaxID=2936508 RepID=UPI00200CEAC9|nr:STM4012 family radical SAM protein [Paenibacillus hamazuiensis]